MRNKCCPFPLDDDHVHRRATGHLRAGAAEPVAGPTTDANVVLSPKQPTDDLPGDARQVVRGRLRDFTVRSTKINSSPWAPSSKTARTAAVIRVPRNQLSRGHCRGHIDPAPLDEVDQIQGAGHWLSGFDVGGQESTDLVSQLVVLRGTEEPAVGHGLKDVQLGIDPASTKLSVHPNGIGQKQVSGSSL